MKILTLIFFALVLTACSSDADHTASEIVKPSCGYFDADDCTCSDSLKLVVTDGKKECINTKAKNVCLSRNDGFHWALTQKDTSVLQSCLVFSEKGMSSTVLNDARLVIVISNISHEDQKKFVKWADKNTVAFSNLRPLIAPTPVETGELLSVANPTGSDYEQHMPYVLDPMVWRLLVAPDLFGFLAPKIFAKIEDLIAYIENPNAKVNIDGKVFAKNKVAKTLLDFYQKPWPTDFVLAKVLSEAGCSDSCLREYDLGALNGFRAVLKEYLYEDVVYRTEIVLHSESNSIVGSLYLANKHPLIFNIFERQEKDLIKTIYSYNVYGQIVYSYNDYYNAAELIEGQSDNVHFSAEFDSLIGVCENDIRPDHFAKSGIAKNLAFGPKLNLSYYGWLNKFENTSDYWRTYFYLNDLGLSFASIADYSDHALSVSKILLQDTELNEIGLVPLGISSCFDAKALNGIWSEIKKSLTPMKVVNLSATDYISKAICEQSFESHPLVQDEEVLWIIAAGNYSASKPNICPQYLAGRKNIIIVGATTGNSMSAISSYGVDWVDIAAPGETYEGQNTGATSYATPRVAKVAARLFKIFPKLTVEQVKVSILLGAVKKSWNALPVRSGGEVNEERALNYAELFSEGLSYKDAIHEIECGSKGFTCEDAKSKLKLVKEITQ